MIPVPAGVKVWLATGHTDIRKGFPGLSLMVDGLFDGFEREINELDADQRLDRRRKESLPLFDELQAWLQTERAKLSRSSPVAEVIDYMLKRWDGFTSFLDDDRICLTNNAAERALRGFALGRESWLFAGSDRGADRAAFMATLIMTAKLNDIDPQAWLADVLARIGDTPITRLEQLLPWN
jgi:transposase